MAPMKDKITNVILLTGVDGRDWPTTTSGRDMKNPHD